MIDNCAACGATHEYGDTCDDYFHQMLYWENERVENGEVHHLMVASFYIQHPHLMSVEGLCVQQNLLAQFMAGVTPEAMRIRQREAVDSGNRVWKISALPGNVGHYDPPIQWSMTTTDVIMNGIDLYRESVRSWAAAICTDLRSANLLPTEPETN